MGRKAIEMVGKKFGRWTVIKRSGSNKGSKPMWLCQCECGNQGIINGASLRKGDSTSCRCYMREVSTTHGMYKSRLNKTYRGMKQRCLNYKNNRYHYYGGRGITMCEEWLGEIGPVNFINWALSNGYTDELSIDRIDNEGNYEPSNCRWVNQAAQCRNRGIKTNNKSGAEGVWLRTGRANEAWRVTIGANGKNVNLGTFHVFEDAVKARKEAELKYWNKGGDKNGS